MANRDRIIDIVRKMLLHADSAKSIGSLAEAEAFTLKAAELMTAHRIERMEVVGDTDDLAGYGTTLCYVAQELGDDRLVPWQVIVFSIIAESQACQAVVINGDPFKRFFVAGEEVDRAVTIGLAKVITDSINRLFGEEWERAMLVDAAVISRACSRDQYQESYLGGFCSALDARLKEQEQKQLATTETGLILIGKAVAKTRQLMKQEFGGDQGEADAVLQTSHNGAANAGWRDGMKVSLGTDQIEAGGGAQAQQAIGDNQKQRRIR